MTIHSKDPMQEAADQAGGFEGALLKHNCKDGEVYLDGVVAEPGLKVVPLMDTAAHGWVRFEDDKLVDRDIRRYADVSPDRGEGRPDWSPNTSVLCVSLSGSLMTYSAASSAARGAFEAQLLKPYVRLRKMAFPVVTLGFRPQKDDYGNFRPTFTIESWRPRGDFAALLGEGPMAPQLTGPGPNFPTLPGENVGEFDGRFPGVALDDADDL